VPNVLIFRACAVGDFVLNLPALEALQENIPEVQLTLVGYPHILDLARDFVRVSSVQDIEKEPWRRLFHEPIGPLEGYDRAIVWISDGTLARNLELSAVGSVLHAAPFSRDCHIAEHLLRTIGIPTFEYRDRWRPETDRIVLHPGSGSPGKCWPYFQELARRLGTVTFLIGPAESDFDSGGHERIENRDLRQVAAALSRSRVFVGNDSGIAHLAGYLGCPTVVLFGPTDPAIWRPVGKRVRVIHKPDLQDIAVEEVMRAIVRES
jgi:ADP-heptose:LPS heptosyltransferase